MTIDERVRHDLYEGLERVVGETPAKLLMTAIPPFSWDYVATKSDIAELKGDDHPCVRCADIVGGCEISQQIWTTVMSWRDQRYRRRLWLPRAEMARQTY